MAQKMAIAPAPMPCEHPRARPAEFFAKSLIVAHHRIDNVSSEQRLFTGAGGIFTMKSVPQMFFGERARALHVVEPYVVNHNDCARFQQRMKQPQVTEDIRVVMAAVHEDKIKDPSGQLGQGGY